METQFLLAFGEEEFLAPLAITGKEAFFNKLQGERSGEQFSIRPKQITVLFESALGAELSFVESYL